MTRRARASYDVVSVNRMFVWVPGIGGIGRQSKPERR